MKYVCPLYQCYEWIFSANPGCENPWSGLGFKAHFKGPQNRSFSISGFYDGTDQWKIRAAFTFSGRWTFHTTCPTLPDLDGRTGAIEVGPPDNTLPLSAHGGFLRVNPRHHCLTYTDGTPFFWLGDTWWHSPSDLMPLTSSNRPDIPAMLPHLLARRQNQQFTILHIAFLGELAGVGVQSFLKTRHSPDFPATYWQQADQHLQAIRQAGLIAAIALSWSAHYDTTDPEDWKHLWAYVVARYGAFPVTWLVCGEYNEAIQSEHPDRVTKALELGRFIKCIDPYQRAMTIHPWAVHAWADKGDRREAWPEPWCDFIMLQGGHQGPKTTINTAAYQTAYHNPAGKPVVEGETNYEGILKDHPVTPAGVRLAAYHAIQNGSFGFTYGSHGLWYPIRDENDTTFSNWGKPIPWWISIQAPGAENMTVLKRIYESVEWWKLEPWPASISAPEWTGAGHIPMAKGSMNPLAILIYFPPEFPPREKTRFIWPAPIPPPRRTHWINPRSGDLIPLAAPSLLLNPDGILPDRPAEDDWILRICS